MTETKKSKENVKNLFGAVYYLFVIAGLIIFLPTLAAGIAMKFQIMIDLFPTWIAVTSIVFSFIALLCFIVEMTRNL